VEVQGGVGLGMKIFFGFILGALLLAFLVVAAMVFFAVGAKSIDTAAPVPVVETPPTPVPVVETPPTWVYHTSEDEMGRGTIRTARISSANTVSFGSPYEGPQHARLSLRVHPRYGKDVFLAVERGQFLCGLEDCTVEVSFDGAKPQTYRVVEPSDHCTTMLFIQDYDSFVAKARKAKIVKIEAQFYEEGNRVFEFHVEGLKW
jgi:hypothetical protein